MLIKTFMPCSYKCRELQSVKSVKCTANAIYDGHSTGHNVHGAKSAFVDRKYLLKN